MTPTPASADPPVCPVAPAAYGGTDDVVNELRELRREASATCDVLAARLAELADDTADLAFSDDLEHDVALTAIVPELLPLAVVDEQLHDDNVGAPAIGTVELGPDARAHLDDNVTAMRGDVWWTIGALGGLGCVFLFWRIIRPAR